MKEPCEESELADEGVLFRDGETDDVLNDQSIGLRERLTQAAIRLSENHSNDMTLRNDAMRAIGGNLASLRKAMAAQKRFDKATVKRVVDLARILMQHKLLSDMKGGEIKRLLSAIKNSVGKKDISASVESIMDIMIDNMLRNGESALHKLLTVKGSKVDARGVEVQGVLDAEGQAVIKVVKDSLSLKEEDIAELINEASNRLNNPDKTISDNALIEYTGLNIALDYIQNISDSKADEKSLRDGIKADKERKDAGTITPDEYRQAVEAAEEAIRKNKIDRAEAYINLVGKLSDSLRQSILNAKSFREAEKRRVREIQHDADADMQGRASNEHHKDSWKDRFMNNGISRFVLAPLATFDQIFRVFGNKSANGEGYLWNRFMRGWVDSRNKELKGIKEKYRILDKKISEISGGKISNTGELIRKISREPGATVSFWDGEEKRDHKLTHIEKRETARPNKWRSSWLYGFWHNARHEVYYPF